MPENVIRMLYPSFAFSRSEKTTIGDDTDEKKNRQDRTESEL